MGFLTQILLTSWMSTFSANAFPSLPFSSLRSSIEATSRAPGVLHRGLFEGSTMRSELILLALVFIALLVLVKLGAHYNQTRLMSWPYLAISLKSSCSRLPPIEGPTFQLPRLRLGSNLKMTMGLKRLDFNNWLTLDEMYFKEHCLRERLLATKHANVVQCLPGTEEACQEILDLVSEFLASRYPKAFTVSGAEGSRHIINHLTGESFPLSDSPRPLEIAARLAMEDFTILVKGQTDEHYHIRASATLFPAGWKLQERIGWSMAALHAPVPKWQETIGRSVDRYFDHISTNNAMERYNLFLQPNNTLFHDTSATMLQHGQPDVDGIYPSTPLTASDIQVRRERQTFRRLPKSGAILFTVRTYLTPLVEVDAEEIPALKEQVDNMSDDMAQYKGKNVWGPVVKEYCQEKLTSKNDS